MSTSIRNHIFRSASFAVCAALALFAGSVSAGSNTGTLTVQATVSTNCTMNSPTLNFGTIDPTAAADANVSTTLSVKCTKGTTITDIKLDPGGNQIASGKRQMINGTDTIPYGLYTDSGYTTMWGDGTAGIGSALSSGFSASTSAATAMNFTIYGQVLAADEDVPAASYSDSVTITVDF